MINIIGARGCYSHYLANILAVGTNLTSATEFFQLSSTGDSHSIRDSVEIAAVISTRHFKYLGQPPYPGEKFIIIEPDRNHVLDYLDNSFSKESNYHLNDWFDERLINRDLMPEQYFSDIIEFLKSNQIWTIDARTIAPENKPWMLRELLSYKIAELMFSCYERYFMLTYRSKIKSTDFFDNFESALTELVDSLGLKFKMPMPDIIAHNQTFVKHQQFHGIQKLCDQFVDSTINGDCMENPCISIFDEAYVQYKLRNAGWEIEVDNLNKFPNSAELSKIIYPANLKTS